MAAHMILSALKPKGTAYAGTLVRKWVLTRISFTIRCFPPQQRYLRGVLQEFPTENWQSHPRSSQLAMTLLAVLRWLRYNAHTLFLFTKSDMKTILMPITLFAWCTVPETEPTAFVHSVLWTWLFLLQFCVSNQSLSPDEDLTNKPWRPIPSGRISVRNSLVLRWTLLPICVAISIAHKITAVGAVLTLGILLHNELRLDSYWLTRNVLNALGYAMFDAGATAIARADSTSKLPPSALAAHYLSIAIVLTTIHAQDFQDEAGDRAEKRRTIPIVMPHLGRISMLVGMISWSVGLGAVWNRSVSIFVALFIIGGIVGARFYYLRTPEADKRSYLLYNIWLALARITPLYA